MELTVRITSMMIGAVLMTFIIILFVLYCTYHTVQEARKNVDNARIEHEVILQSQRELTKEVSTLNTLITNAEISK